LIDNPPIARTFPETSRDTDQSDDTPKLGILWRALLPVYRPGARRLSDAAGDVNARIDQAHAIVDMARNMAADCGKRSRRQAHEGSALAEFGRRRQYDDLRHGAGYLSGDYDASRDVARSKQIGPTVWSGDQRPQALPRIDDA